MSKNMVFAFVLMLALISATHDPIEAAIENYKSVESYRVILITTDSKIRYYYKKPGFLRMEFIKPHKGAVLVYNPFNQKVRIRPFGFLKFFVLTLNPENRLITSPTGHKVNESDIGALLSEVKILLSNGESNTLGDETIGGKQVEIVSIKGKEDFTAGKVHKYLLWLDKKTFLPLRVSSYNLKGELIEEVLMDDLQINLEFTDDFFEF